MAITSWTPVGAVMNWVAQTVQAVRDEFDYYKKLADPIKCMHLSYSEAETYFENECMQAASKRTGIPHHWAPALNPLRYKIEPMTWCTPQGVNRFGGLFAASMASECKSALKSLTGKEYRLLEYSAGYYVREDHRSVSSN